MTTASSASSPSSLHAARRAMMRDSSVVFIDTGDSLAACVRAEGRRGEQGRRESVTAIAASVVSRRTQRGKLHRLHQHGGAGRELAWRSAWRPFSPSSMMA